MRQCGKGLNVNNQPTSSFYDLKITQSKKVKNYYAEQREKALKILGQRYVLAIPVARIR